MKLKQVILFLLVFYSTQALQAQCTASYSSVEASGTVTFTNLSTGHDWSYWDFGDGNNAGTENPVHSYDSAGTYYVCLIVGDFFFTCSDTICDSVVVTAAAPPCAANFTFTEVDGTITLTNTSSGLDTAAYPAAWDYGDGDNGFGNTVSHTYADTGTYNVCVIINDFGGCGDTLCQLITVDSVPVFTPCAANFSFTILSDTVLFANTSTGVDTSVATAYWDFGDGSFPGFGNNVDHIYGTPGTYDVCLIINDFGSCNDTLCQSVTIAGTPPPACSASFTTSVSGGTVTLTSTSTGTSAFTIYTWIFTDGSLPTIGNPATHNFADPGIKPICLVIYDLLSGCSDTTCTIVFIMSGTGGCQADFEWSPSGSDVTFTDMSTYTDITTTYTWDYGDGTTEGPFPFYTNPTHTYDWGGTYNVCLTISDMFSACEDSVCYTVTVIGIEEESGNFMLKAYPNPVGNEFLTIESGSPIKNVSVIGMDGKRIQSNQMNPVTHYQLATNFARGVYTVEVETQSGKKQFKLVKE